MGNIVNFILEFTITNCLKLNIIIYEMNALLISRYLFYLFAKVCCPTYTCADNVHIHILYIKLYIQMYIIFVHIWSDFNGIFYYF